MKKKILTLVFTLVLLIGVIAAVGMTASAADVLNRNGYVATADNLWNYANQVYNGDAITLNNDIVYDDKYDDEPYYLPFAADGDILLDLNGHTLDITTRADSLIELDYGSTRLHIVNSKAATTESKIIMRTTLGNASIVDLSNKNCSVYVYDGVELVMGEEGDQAEAYRQTHVIKATAFSEIALYGGTLTNNIANGNGIKLTSTTSIAFDNSTVTLHGYAKIKAKTVCIALNDAYDYPTFKIGEATLDAGNIYTAISHYIGTAQQVVDNKTIGDFLYSSSYGAYDLTAAESGGRLENYKISSTTLIDNLDDCDIRFKHTGAVYSCSHSYSSILNYAGGHYKACAYCGRLNVIESHTAVGVKEATSEADGHTAGYDCYCGYKTNEKIAKIGSVTLSQTEYVYDGKTKNPTVTVTDAEGNKLVKNTDYTIKAASGRKNPGTYNVVITFKGKYSGTVKTSFEISLGKAVVTKTAQSTSAIKLTWSKVTGATGYRVYRYNAETGKYTNLGTVKKLNATIKKLSAGTTYGYLVRAYVKLSDGTVVWAPYTSADVFYTATKCAAPTLKATAGTKKFSLSWNEVKGATGYEIWYSTSANGSYKKLTTVTDTSYSKSSTTGKTYYFKIRPYTNVDGRIITGEVSAAKGVKIK